MVAEDCCRFYCSPVLLLACSTSEQRSRHMAASCLLVGQHLKSLNQPPRTCSPSSFCRRCKTGCWKDLSTQCSKIARPKRWQRWSVELQWFELALLPKALYSHFDGPVQTLLAGGDAWSVGSLNTLPLQGHHRSMQGHGHDGPANDPARCPRKAPDHYGELPTEFRTWRLIAFVTSQKTPISSHDMVTLSVSSL